MAACDGILSMFIPSDSERTISSETGSEQPEVSNRKGATGSNYHDLTARIRMFPNEFSDFVQYFNSGFISA